MVETQGTQEWCYRELNICKGCPNNCFYCYARSIANHFGWKKTEDWSNMEIIEKKVKKGYRKLKNPTNKFDYMFPTSHDIVPQNIKECIIVLKKVLKAGNTVLITTKPKYSLIRKLCEELIEWKDQILFRFTITSADNKILKKYEPNAPSYKSRYLSVFDAFYEYGYKTSISIEPFLDLDPIYLITQFFETFKDGRLSGVDIVTDTIWLGIMSGVVPDELKSNYTKYNLTKIIKRINKLPEKIRNRIRLKDSIRNKVKTKLLREKIKETPKKTNNKRLDKWLR